MLAALCIPFPYYGANRDQGTLFHFTGTLWGTLSPDLLLAMCNSIFGKGQQAVGAGIDGVWRMLIMGRERCVIQNFETTIFFMYSVLLESMSFKK